ncbi:MAG: hypothetical protein ABI222_16635 [Opitutaceae bacterium]
MLIDTHAFLGPWPFYPHPPRSGRGLAAQLAAHAVRRAYVSPLGAAFLPEPMPANRELFAAVRRVSVLIPVPVINPALAAWRHHLDACQAAAPISAVRLMPNYHNYSLRRRDLGEFMAEISRRGLHLAVSVRLEDERNRYFGLAVKGVPVGDLAAFLNHHPHHHVLCNGLYKGEIERLAQTCDNFSADLTFAEFLDTIRALRATLPARRIMLGTGTPLLSIAAQIAKLRFARIPAAELAAIGAGNAVKFFERQRKRV